MPIKFATKRGRPRQNAESEQSEIDRGTDESRLKYHVRLTKEPIDLLLEYRFISESEHRAAIHFRWLYSLRYGIDTLTAAPLALEERNYQPDMRGDAWHKAREEEFSHYATLLRRAGCYDAMHDLLIQNLWPPTLIREHVSRFSHQRTTAIGGHHAMEKLRDGCRLLTKPYKPT